MKLLVLKKLLQGPVQQRKNLNLTAKKAVLILTKSSELLSLRETLKVLGLQIYLQKNLVVVQKKSGAGHQSSPNSQFAYAFYNTAFLKKP